MAKKKVKMVAGKEQAVVLYTVDPPFSKETPGYFAYDQTTPGGCTGTIFLAHTWSVDSRQQAVLAAQSAAMRYKRTFYPHTAIAGLANEDDLA